MNQQYFQSGKPFNYKGRFQRLKRQPITFHKSSESITDADDIVYDVRHISESGFKVYNRHFGNIGILYSECEPVTSKA